MNAPAARDDSDLVSRHSIVGVAVDSAFAADLFDPRSPGTATEFGRAVDASDIDFLVLGADRLAPGRPDTPTLDSTVAATILARHTDRAGIVVTAASWREHPFNVARRLASLDHGSRGRVGWLTGPVDHAAPAADAVWSSADPLDTAADAVAVARSLWGSWPADSIVNDPVRGVFAESHRITYIDHDGAYAVSGPLNVPEPPQGRPPVFWSPRDEWELDVARRVADVVVVSDEHAAASYRAAVDPDAARDRALLVDVHWTPDLDPVPGTAADGVLVHGATRGTWKHVLAAVARRPIVGDPRVSLRDRLGLGAPEPGNRGARSLFPVT
ncbi:LLM class flavin-dependent oxidoreductase [Rhodococcus koreensis]|uniref:LLM class flavin-dependent oxidoreductase n=1 Tax=Rhodococcus koreensis TaxID=99653 RepID=UPI00366E743C